MGTIRNPCQTILHMSLEYLVYREQRAESREQRAESREQCFSTYYLVDPVVSTYYALGQYGSYFFGAPLHTSQQFLHVYTYMYVYMYICI
jgi:hypothetical protein